MKIRVYYEDTDAAGIVYYDFEIMFKVFIAIVIFSVIIGLISFIIKKI